MEYTTEVLDPTTGELITVAENWLTITEYGRTKNLGSRQTRATLARLGLLQPEIECRMVPMILDPALTKPDYRTTLRLTHDAVKAGLGMRLLSRDELEFDVLSPAGRRWADERWPVSEPTISTRDTFKEEVRRLLMAGKTQAEIARMTGRSRQLVSLHARTVGRPSCQAKPGLR